MARKHEKSAPSEAGFSFSDGIYVEQNELEIDDKRVTQTSCQKSKMVLEMYRQLPQKYSLLFQKTFREPLPLSKKLDVKYLYNISAKSVHFASASAFGSSGAASQVRMEYMQRDQELRQRLKAKEDRFAQRADNFERFQHGSFYTNEERYIRGSMSRDDYYEEKFSRDSRQYFATEKEADAISGNLRAMNYYAAKATGDANASRKRVMEQNEKIRIMPVGEVVYCDGEVAAIVIYREPQDIMEIQCAQNMDVAYLEGKLLTKKVIMKRTVDHKPLLRYISEKYGIHV